MHNYLIVGAGWAGLSAAVKIANDNPHSTITILEAAPKAGGRARSVPFDEHITVDNGQHLFIGAYENLLNLIDIIGVPAHQLFYREPLNLVLHRSNSSQYPLALKLPNLPSPFHLLAGFIKAKGLTIRERLNLAHFWRHLKKTGFDRYFNFYPDISVQSLLEHHHQSTLISSLWGPIALAALSTPIHRASAKIFCRVLKNTFSSHQKHSNWLFAKQNLSEIFPNPAIQFLKKRHHIMCCNERVQELIIQQNRCVGVKTKTNKIFLADKVILALPSKGLLSLFEPHKELQVLKNQFTHFQYQPITTLYFKFNHAIQLKSTMIGLVDSKTTAQWVFQKNITDKLALLSVIISGEGEHQQLERKILINKVISDIQTYYPNVGTPNSCKIITEKMAAFSADVGIDAIRPSNQTPISNLYLAGDYTQTGYPACIEGAVKSGIKAANYAII